MRLLLLLSALLATLSGVASPRAVAQPVQASAAANIAATAGSVVTASARRYVVPAYPATPLRLIAPAPFALAASRLLYAERRRE